MGIIRNHLKYLKENEPREYASLMNGYANEDEFIREALGLSKKAIAHYTKTKAEVTRNE